MLFGIVCCTKIPELSEGFAHKSRIGIAAGKWDRAACAFKSRKNFGLNFVRDFSAEFRDFGAKSYALKLRKQLKPKDDNSGI
jgi:hypothetical protein